MRLCAGVLVDGRSMLPDWRGLTAIVVASGQSASELAPRLPQKGAVRVLVVNLGFRLFPNADVMYAADSGFWQWYTDARKFAGIKLAPDARARPYCSALELVEIPKDASGRRTDTMIFDQPGVIGCGGGNSGFQAVNLAINFGARRIALCGFDYGGKHWHEDHPPALRNPTADQFKRWRTHLDNAAPAIAARGVEVVNLSESSTLKAYPHVNPECLFADP